MIKKIKKNKKFINNKKFFISIITVVLNGEKHLAKTIKSVLDQKYKNFEYIIVDGNRFKPINIIVNSSPSAKLFNASFPALLMASAAS